MEYRASNDTGRQKGKANDKLPSTKEKNDNTGKIIHNEESQGDTYKEKTMGKVANGNRTGKPRRAQRKSIADTDAT